MRNTRQREAIKNAFEEVGRPISPAECLELAGASVPQLGQATVYRNIKRLVEEGFLRVVELPGEPDRYETAGKHHHHHFHCRSCDRVFEVNSCPGGFAEVTPPGFELEDHELILYGKCSRCVCSASDN
ncbi:MAG: transcriptional repressor [Acidobacteriota bacterium]